MSLNQDLFDRGVDHAAMLRMYEEGLQQKVESIHKRHLARLRRAFRDNDIRRTREIQRVIQREIRGTLQEYQRVFNAEFKDFVSGEAQFAANSLNRSVGDYYRIETPNRSNLRNQVATTRFIQNRTLSQDFIRIAAGEQTRIMSEIRRGFQEGLTETQITSRILNGSATDLTRSQTRTLVRTAMTRLSTKAALMTYEANSDVLAGYQYVATLDDRTTQICARHDGQIFKLDANYRPLPPLHWNCRSTTIPITSNIGTWEGDRFKRDPANAPSGFRASAQGTVPQTTNYDVWLRGQSFDTQIRHFQFDRERLDLWLSGNLPLRKFTNPDGSFISLSTLRDLDRAATERRAIRTPVSGNCYNPCTDINDPQDVRRTQISDIDLNILTTDLDTSQRLIHWFQVQSTSGNLRYSVFRGNTLKSKRASSRRVYNQTVESHPDNFYYDPGTRRYVHKDVGVPDLQTNQILREGVRRNQTRKSGAVADRRPNETQQQYYDRIFDPDSSLGLTEEQQDWILNTFLVDTKNQFDLNVESTIIRSLTNLLRAHNRGSIRTNPNGYLVNQFGDTGDAINGIGQLVTNNQNKLFRTGGIIDRDGILNSVTQSFEDLDDLVRNSGTIRTDHSTFRWNPSWLADEVASINRTGLSDSDLTEIVRESFQWAATRGVDDLSLIQTRIGKMVWGKTNTPKRQLLSKRADAIEEVSQNQNQWSRTGRVITNSLLEPLENNGIRIVTRDTQYRRVQAGDPINANSSGGYVPVREYRLDITDQQLLDQRTRTRQIQIIDRLGVLEDSPELRLTPRGYVDSDGNVVRSGRTRGSNEPLTDDEIARANKANAIALSVDEEFASAMDFMVRTRGTTLRNQTISSRRQDVFQAVRYYLNNDYTTTGGRRIRQNHQFHEYNRMQGSGIFSQTSGEFVRPFIEIDEYVLGEAGFINLKRYTGQILTKKLSGYDTYDSWETFFDDNVDGLIEIGDLLSILGRGTAHRMTRMRLGRITKAQALERLERHTLLKSADADLRNELLRASLEVSRIRNATGASWSRVIGGDYSPATFRRYRTTILGGNDASSQGPALVSTIRRNQQGMRATNVINQGSKNRVYDVTAEDAIEQINVRLEQELGIQIKLNVEDLSKLQKDNVMTAFYGSLERSRIDRITDGAAEALPRLLEDLVRDGVLDETLIVATRRDLRIINTAYKGAIARATDEGDALLVSALQQQQRDIVASLTKGSTLEDELLALGQIDNPEVRDIIERLTDSPAGIIGNDTIRIIGEELSESLVRNVGDPRAYFDPISEAASTAARLINKYSDTPVTTLPVRDYTGKITYLDFTATERIENTFIDAFGVTARTLTVQRLDGIVDLGAIRRGYPVKFIFNNDAALASRIELDNDGVLSVYDGFYGAFSNLDGFANVGRQTMIDIYRSNVLIENLGALRQHIVDNIQDSSLRQNALREWDALRDDWIEQLDISEVDEDLIRMILDDPEWYGITF